jgi:hypothetical protein
MTDSGFPSRDRASVSPRRSSSVSLVVGGNGRQHLSRERGLAESRQRTLCGACGDMSSTGGGVRLGLPGLRASVRRCRISGKHEVLGDARVVFYVHDPEAANARCPSSTSRPARPAAANARGDASSALAARGSRTALYSSSTPIERDRLPRRVMTEWWLCGNRRLIACEAWRPPPLYAWKYLQIGPNGRGQ